LHILWKDSRAVAVEKQWGCCIWDHGVAHSSLIDVSLNSRLESNREEKKRSILVRTGPCRATQLSEKWLLHLGASRDIFSIAKLFEKHGGKTLSLQGYLDHKKQPAPLGLP
jgi:hypothetical protein